MSAPLNAICRGLVGYVSYLATCRMSSVYSEYLLYEPILRIAKSQGYTVNCEVPVRSLKASVRGDYPRIDFKLTIEKKSLALEVKWLTSASINLQKDILKLQELHTLNDIPGYILLFGTHDLLDRVEGKLTRTFLRKGKMVNWNAGRTSYAANWYRFF